MFTSTRFPPTASCRSILPAMRITARTSSTRTTISSSMRCGSCTAARARAPATFRRCWSGMRISLIFRRCMPRRGRRKRSARRRSRMPQSDLALAPLQEWMQSVVTHPSDVYDAADAAAIAVDDVILPSQSLQPIQRIGIYHGMYMLRMIEALTVDYAALAQFLGEHAFEHLVREYVQQFPSRSYTFNRLGDALPEYIASLTWKRRTFLRDLAKLELAMTQVFDEAEAAPLPADAIASIAPEEVADARIIPIPALRLIALDYDANETFQAFREERPMKPRRQKTWLAVHRKDYGVYRMPLAREAYVFLEALAARETIGSAIETFSRRFRRFPEQSELFAWFRDWSAAGLFTAIEVA